jgi:hypothetical protein
MIVSDRRKKVHRLRDGSIVAWSGSVQQAELLLWAMRKKTAQPKLTEISALHLRADGSLWEYDQALVLLKGTLLWVSSPKSSPTPAALSTATWATTPS